MKKFDLIIIGGGAGAFAAAIRADELKAKTAMINAGLPLGGTCVNVGCVPSKFLLEVGFDRFRTLHPRFRSLAPTEIPFDFAAAIREKEDVVSRNRRSKYKDVLDNYKNIRKHYAWSCGSEVSLTA